MQKHNQEMGQRAIELTEDYMTAKRSHNVRKKDAERKKRVRNHLPKSRNS